MGDPMSLYAWTQDVPIDAAMYREICARMGDAKMPGLVAHIAMENEDGTVRYLDVWESQEAHDAAFEQIVHPAVHPVLTEHRVEVRREPPRTALKVLDVRFADGTTVQG
jgi:hypothetical protein